MTSRKLVVIVTGATSGIGKDAAIEFARLGHSVSLAGRNEKAMKEVVAECERAGAAKVCTTLGDIIKKETAEAIVRNTINTCGVIDVLVNNAGIGDFKSIEDAEMSDYDTIFNTNLRSVVQLTKLSMPHIIKQKGTVVNVSSLAGVRGLGFYCMSKAALDMFTRTYAWQVAEHGVRVNSINPGVIVTNIFARLGLNGEQEKAFLKGSESKHPLGRNGQVSETSRAIIFLATDASSFTTGETLLVDGGRHLVTPL